MNQNLEQYFQWLISFPRAGAAEYLSLDRVKILLKKLGNPQNKLRGVQVAGTNGKGSVVAMLETVLVEAGYKVGVFTSPHLANYTERFRINKKNISEAQLARIIDQLKPAVAAVEKELNDRPSWFEVLTVAGVLLFLSQKVDVVIFEVGLGGRLDATTSLGLSTKIITNIALDHTQILGKTLAKIAAEKAAIVQNRNDFLVTSGLIPASALSVIVKKIKQKKAKISIVPKDAAELIKLDLTGTHFSLPDLGKLKTNLIGFQQAHHAALVWQGAKRLRQIGFKILDKDFKIGLTKVKWAARFQIVSRKPLIIFDGAHNPDGIRMLIKTLRALPIDLTQSVAVFAVKENKQIAPMLKNLSRNIPQIIFPSVAKYENLASLAKARSLKKYYWQGIIAQDIKQSLAMAKREVGKNGAIIICGSLYFIGEIIKQKLISGKKQ